MSKVDQGQPVRGTTAYHLSGCGEFEKGLLVYVCTD
jgi:hypothetical protein